MQSGIGTVSKAPEQEQPWPPGGGQHRNPATAVMQRGRRDGHHQESAIRIHQDMPLAADDTLGGIVALRIVVDITRIGFSFLLIVCMLPVAACLSLHGWFPEQYAAAPFRLKPYVLCPCIVFALAGIKC